MEKRGLETKSYTQAHAPVLLIIRGKPATNPSSGVYCNRLYQIILRRQKNSVNCSPLRRQFDGTKLSMSESRSDHSQRLNLAQEEVLIGFINKLTDCSMPPTSQIVKNVAEELASGPVRKAQFTGRYCEK